MIEVQKRIRFLGYNYRISELNAAVGIAQLRKLDHTLSVQEKNYTVLRNALTEIPEVTFRRVPKTGVENYSFLNIFLPNEDIARKAHKALGAHGVDACFYWFDNNWHYYKKWEHLLEQKSLGKLSPEVQSGLQRTIGLLMPAMHGWEEPISCLVKLGWSEEETRERATNMVAAIKSVL